MRLLRAFGFCFCFRAAECKPTSNRQRVLCCISGIANAASCRTQKWPRYGLEVAWQSEFRTRNADNSPADQNAPWSKRQCNSSMHRYECVALCKDINLQRGRFCARSLAQGRLNQWAHWARAEGHRIFFLFEGPPTGCGEIIF